MLAKTIAHIKRKLGMDKRENEKLRAIKERFTRRTAAVGDEWELSDFLNLLELAEYGNFGKSNAIIFAYKIGYLEGKGGGKE